MLKGGGRFDNALILLKDIKKGKFDLESDDNYYKPPLKKIKILNPNSDALKHHKLTIQSPRVGTGALS